MTTSQQGLRRSSAARVALRQGTPAPLVVGHPLHLPNDVFAEAAFAATPADVDSIAANNLALARETEGKLLDEHALRTGVAATLHNQWHPTATCLNSQLSVERPQSVSTATSPKRSLPNLSQETPRSLRTTIVIPSKEELLALVSRVHPDHRPVWNGFPPDDQAALAAYYLPHCPTRDPVGPARPKVIKWYCPYACQARFPTGHRYCINLYVGCAHRCRYWYAVGYEREAPALKRGFRHLIDRDMADLEQFNVPPAPVHLSNSTDPFQPLENESGDTRYALEQTLAHRRRFTTVTILTKNPSLPLDHGYVNLFRRLMDLPPGHPRSDDFRRTGAPPFQLHVSLAFWRDAARAAYDLCAPPIEDRLRAVRALRQHGIPVVLRIDPLFPRSPLAGHPPTTFEDFGLVEPQTLDDLVNLVAFAKEVNVRHIVYSATRIVQPRGQMLSETMKALRDLYHALSAPGKAPWGHGGWRLPPQVSDQHVIPPFRDICSREGVTAKFCMQDLIETP